MKKKLFTLFLALITGTIAFAHDAAIGNIYYLLDSDTKTATVTYRGINHDSYSNEYSGSVVIPASVTYDGVTYFVTSIGDYAFMNCTSITSITIPNGVISIGQQALCGSMTSLIIPNSVITIGNYACSACSKLTSVYIGESVTSIGNYAFYGCSLLTSVTIPNSVTSIGECAFTDCSSLTSITIGSGVKSIGIYAFFGCNALRRIIINAFNPPYMADQNSAKNNPACYIPCGTLEAYINSDWSDYCQQFIEQSSLYEVMVESNNNSSGVAKLVSRLDCTSAIITAIPNEGCTFVKWSDGNTQATRYLELTEDISLTAYFAKEGYTIHVYQDCNTTIE